MRGPEKPSSRLLMKLAALVRVGITPSLSEQLQSLLMGPSRLRTISLGLALEDLEDLLEEFAELPERLSPQPFTAETTVHEAWRRHPSPERVFAPLGLSDCPRCPVGEDETLEELAEGYGIPLDQLLSSLQGFTAGGS